MNSLMLTKLKPITITKTNLMQHGTARHVFTATVKLELYGLIYHPQQRHALNIITRDVNGNTVPCLATANYKSAQKKRQNCPYLKLLTHH